MENIEQKQLIGISSAARFLGWTAGKFGGYYYSKRTPEPQIIDNRPVWCAESLAEWGKTIKRRKLRKRNMKSQGL